MTYFEAVELLVNHKPISKVGCSYCGAINKETTIEILAALIKCTNCRVDIQMAGQWSGYGIDALQKAVKLNPLSASWPKLFEGLGLVESEPEMVE